jgi:putative hydrolase of the HAD superfamily
VISVVLVDVDGVLRRWDPAIISDAERDHGLPAGSLRGAAFADPWLTQAVTGALSDADWRAGVTARLTRATTAPLDRAAAAVAQWSASAGAVDSDVLELLRRQRGTRTVALLSNATDRLEVDLQRLGVLHELDAVYNSSRLGVAKPDPAVFAAVCADLAVPAQRCAFVDDTLPHVSAAASAGLRAHHFTHAEALEAFLATLP